MNAQTPIEEDGPHVPYRAEGSVIWFHPQPQRNADGTTSYGMSFPAVAICQGVKDPEKVAQDIAEILNRSTQEHLGEA